MMKLIDKNKIDFTTIEPYEYANEPMEVVFKEDIDNEPTIKAVSFEALEKMREEIQKRATTAMNERYEQGLRTALEIIDKLIESESE